MAALQRSERSQKGYFIVTNVHISLNPEAPFFERGLSTSIFRNGSAPSQLFTKLCHSTKYTKFVEFGRFMYFFKYKQIKSYPL